MPTTRVLSALILIAASACANPPPPLSVSSADEAGYAERYPAALAATRSRFQNDETEASKLVLEFSKYPDQLDKPSWPAVGSIVELADRAGRGGDFAAGMAETEGVRTFYEEEKDPIRQKVGGSVDYAVKQKQCQCDVEFYGTAAGALDRAMDAQIQERLRAHNVAHRAIEDNLDALGKQNQAKLEKQADQIALASYLVHVRMRQAKRDLDASLADASGVKSTLARVKENANAVANDPNASKQAKQVAAKRSAAAAGAEAALDAEVNEAKHLSEQIEARSQAAARDYEKALDALQEQIEARAKAEPKK
jgi:hypothetical protein